MWKMKKISAEVAKVDRLEVAMVSMSASQCLHLWNSRTISPRDEGSRKLIEADEG